MSVVISVKTAEKATSCTAAAPENGAVSPDQVEIGGTVSYLCDEDYLMSGTWFTCGSSGVIYLFRQLTYKYNLLKRILISKERLLFKSQRQ